MFKCGDKCAGVLAAEARLVREKTCYATAQRDGDQKTMKKAAMKIKDTQDYIKIMGEWPPAINLAIRPALIVARMRPETKREAIKKEIEAVMETGINPIDGALLRVGVTEVIINYLVSKHDKTAFVREKRFMLTRDTMKILSYLKAVCKQNPKAEKFVSSLMGA